MFKVFLDKEGSPEYEKFRAPVMGCVDTGKTEEVGGVEMPIFEDIEIPHEETRPFISVVSATDISRYLVKDAELVEKTQEDDQIELGQKNLDAVYVARLGEYGSAQDQLDEMYHDFNAWKARIKSVKEKYPKQ